MVVPLRAPPHRRSPRKLCSLASHLLSLSLKNCETQTRPQGIPSFPQPRSSICAHTTLPDPKLQRDSPSRLSPFTKQDVEWLRRLSIEASQLTCQTRN